MPFTPDSSVVWTEIPVRDLDDAMAFYSAVFGYELTIDNNGPSPLSTLPSDGKKGVAGNLYVGNPPAPNTGPTLHFLVPGKLEDAMERCSKAGGTVMPDIMQLPIGRFCYALDPDGNSMGLFEPK